MAEGRRHGLSGRYGEADARHVQRRCVLYSERQTQRYRHVQLYRPQYCRNYRRERDPNYTRETLFRERDGR